MPILFWWVLGLLIAEAGGPAEARLPVLDPWTQLQGAGWLCESSGWSPVGRRSPRLHPLLKVFYLLSRKLYNHRNRFYFIFFVGKESGNIATNMEFLFLSPV